MKFTLSVNDLIAAGGALAALAFLAAVHWALPGAVLGAGVALFGWWRERHEPADGGAGRPPGR